MPKQSRSNRSPELASRSQPAAEAHSRERLAAAAGGPALALILSAFAFVLYANTLTHDYAFDDYSLIKENTLTHEGAAGIGEILRASYHRGALMTDFRLYRPLSRVFFAIEWQLSPDNPALGHWVNVLSYSLTAFLLFHALGVYFRKNLLLSFLAVALFVAHPIHTEVVANIKSLDEILCFLFFIVTMIFVHRYVVTDAVKHLVLSLPFFLLALLSKESAITLLAAAPLMIWFFTDAGTRRNATVTLSLAVVAAVYLLIRARVLGFHRLGDVAVIDNVLSGQDVAHRLASAVFYLGLYLKLLVFPHPLVSDYSLNSIPVIGPADWRFLASFLACLALGLFAVARASRRDVVSFGILFFFVTYSVASNIFVLIGTAFAERLLYTPSLGFCIVVAAALSRLFEEPKASRPAGAWISLLRENSRAVVPLALILALYSARTVSRNADWHDNLTLYTVDVQRSPDSARLHYSLGTSVSRDDFIASLKDPKEARRYLDAATRELTAATRIYPQFDDAYQELGRIYLNRGDFAKAEEYFEKAVAINPGNAIHHNNYGSALFNAHHLAEAKREFEEALRIFPAYADAYYNLGAVYGTYAGAMGRQGNEAESRASFERAIDNFKKAIECDPGSARAYYALGMTFRMVGDLESSRRYVQKARELDPKVN